MQVPTQSVGTRVRRKESQNENYRHGECWRMLCAHFGKIDHGKRPLQDKAEQSPSLRDLHRGKLVPRIYPTPNR